MNRDLKTVLITGASRGIGRAMAERLVQAGYTVYGTSRDPKNMAAGDKVAGVTYYALELGDPKSIDVLVRTLGQVDILINNAGVSQIGPVEEVPMDKVRELFELNLLGVIRLIQGFLPAMRRNKKGFIINISSMAGRFAVPYSAIYAATKHGLEGLTWGLKNEVKEFGIEVCTMAPAYIKTSIPQLKMYSESSPYIENLTRVKTHRDAQIEHGPAPEVVAEKLIRILQTRKVKPSYPVGGSAPLNAFLRKALPDNFLIRMIRRSFHMKD